MPQPTGRMLRRAISELESRGGTMSRDLLLEHLWPLAEPGKGYRLRQKTLAENRRRRERAGLSVEGPRVELTDVEYAERGQRMIAFNRLSGWVRTGIFSQSANGHGTVISLEKLPWDIRREREA